MASSDYIFKRELISSNLVKNECPCSYGFSDWMLFAEILVATSAIRPRADVAYCIHALARRLAKTHNWTVWILTVASSTGFGFLCLILSHEFK